MSTCLSRRNSVMPSPAWDDDAEDDGPAEDEEEEEEAAEPFCVAVAPLECSLLEAGEDGESTLVLVLLLEEEAAAPLEWAAPLVGAPLEGGGAASLLCGGEGERGSVLDPGEDVALVPTDLSELDGEPAGGRVAQVRRRASAAGGGGLRAWTEVEDLWPAERRRAASGAGAAAVCRKGWWIGRDRAMVRRWLPLHTPRAKSEERQGVLSTREVDVDKSG